MLTMDKIKKSAMETMLKNGKHLPHLVICGGGENVAMCLLPDMPEDFVERQKMFGVAGIKLAMEGSDKFGALQKIYFISEGWMSTVEKKDERKPYVQPSKDPKRKEVLTIYSHEVDTKYKDMVVLEIKRDKKGKFSTLKDITPKKVGVGDVKSALIDAFIKGYELATLKLSEMNIQKGMDTMKEQSGLADIEKGLKGLKTIIN